MLWQSSTATLKQNLATGKTQLQFSAQGILTDSLALRCSSMLRHLEKMLKGGLAGCRGVVRSLVTAPRLSVPVSLDSPAMVAAQVPDAVW